MALRRAVFLGALIPLAPSLLPAQALAGRDPIDKAHLQEQRHKRYPDLAKVVDLAQSVPPEFSAHFLLQAATAEGLDDRLWKKEMLERAFQSGSLATEPIRRRSITSADFDVTRTRAEMMSLGFDEKLDRLSLQSISAGEMLKLDRAAALEMFQSISFPRLHQRRCEDALIDDASDFYEALVLIA